MQFSTDPIVSLEKTIQNNENIKETPLNELEETYEIEDCIKWVKENNYERICLQFPDFLLPDSSEIALIFQKYLGKPVYILGDTQYGSCCIDYVTAAHIKADAIIHFGYECFSKSANLIPHLNIYEKCNLNVENFSVAFQNSNVLNDCGQCVVLLDTPYIYKYDKFIEIFSHKNDVSVIKISDEANLINLNENNVIFVTNNERKATNLYLVFHPKQLFLYNPTKNNEKLSNFTPDNAIFKRRNYLIEKIKDSQTFGLVIATLSIKNCLKIIKRLTKILQSRNRKYYLISVGKPTVAKLANFPEVDVYISIACSMNEIQDSREFYKPIVTPWDVEMALNTTFDKNIPFSYDYNTYLTLNPTLNIPDVISDDTNDVSLITGNVRTTTNFKDGGVCSVAIRNDGTVSQYSTNLANRTWRGLEQNLGQNEASEIEIGLSGVASGYRSEGQK